MRRCLRHMRLPIALTVFGMSLAQPATQAVSKTAQNDAKAGPRIAIHCGRFLDAQRAQLLGETTVLIEGSRIGGVLAGHHIPEGAAEIDLSTQTCLPGLIDSHTHISSWFTPEDYVNQFHWNLADYVIRSTVYARRTLLAGFTTARNVGDYQNESVALRNAINAGIVPGPRIFTAGVAMGSTGGHNDPTNGYRSDLAGDPGVPQGIVNSADEAVKAVRLHYKLGDDLIKIMPSGGVMDDSSSGDNPQMTLEEIKGIVSTAHDYGLKVAAHAHGAEAIRRAVLGGVDSIEHGTFMNDEDMRLMKEHGTWYVPTLSAAEFLTEKARVPGYYPAQVAAKAAAIAPQLRSTAARAYKAGVKIAFGTDAAVFPHGENAREFELMVQASMPPMFALQAATVSAAQLLGHEKDLGSLTRGKLADLIAVPGNPLEDISVMKRVSFVMKEGVVYKREGKAVDSEVVTTRNKDGQE